VGFYAGVLFEPEVSVNRYLPAHESDKLVSPSPRPIPLQRVNRARSNDGPLC
jgi:hypothetical protein